MVSHRHRLDGYLSNTAITSTSNDVTIWKQAQTLYTQRKQLFDGCNTLVNGSINLHLKNIPCFGAAVAEKIILIDCEGDINAFHVSEVDVEGLYLFIDSIDTENSYTDVSDGD